MIEDTKQYSETRIEYEEYADSQTLHIEAYMTAEELLKLVCRLIKRGESA